MKELNYKELISDVGIKKGDILDIATGLPSIMLYCQSHNLKFDGNHLLDALKEEVGAEGTVMVRAFSWDFCHDIPFDILHSPSQVGILGNIAMKRDDFERTQHPIYSWVVCGKYKEYLCGMENANSFGEETPFAFLYQNNAKRIRIGNIPWVFTQRHHVEKVANVPYRYEKIFKGKYIDRNGVENIKSYSMYVRKLELQIGYNDYPEMRHEWEMTGVNICKKWNGINCDATKIKEVSDYIYDDLVNNSGKKTLTINGLDGYGCIGK